MPSIFRNTDLTDRVGDLASGVVSNTIGLVSGVASAILSIVIVMITSFYLVLDGEKVLRRISEILPTDNASERYFFDSINRTFGGFLRGTLLLAMLNGLGVVIVMAGAGLGYVLLGGILAFVLTLIPLIGSLLALVLPVLLAALVGDTTKVIAVVAVLLVYQIILFNVIWPKLIGDRMGLHPILVFLALLVGIKEAGFVGAVFGGPVVAVLYAMGMFFLERRAARRAVVTEDSPEADAFAPPPPPPPRRSQFIVERLWPRLRVSLGAVYRQLLLLVRRNRSHEPLDVGR
jgi:predicted PurR-regulated permease PerM